MGTSSKNKDGQSKERKSDMDARRQSCPPTKSKTELREKILHELGQYSLICGLALGAAATLSGCDDDEWYKQIRLEDCNNDGKLDTNDKACQNQGDDEDNSSGSGWYNHSNSYIDYYDWVDVSNW